MISIEVVKLRLAEAIKYSTLTKTEIANYLGVQRSQISCYLHGKKLPSIENLAKLCKILDEDANYILGITN